MSDEVRTEVVETRREELEIPSEERARSLMLDPRPPEEMNAMVLAAMQRTGWRYWLTVALLASFAGLGLIGAWGYQIAKGMGVAGIRRPVFWGVYIANFVFWIGLSHSGTLVSAILRVFKAEFRRPITRAAELLTTFSLAVAALYPLIHLGRTWRFYWMIPYPNQRHLWPNFHSPLEWDMMAIFTYIIGSTLYLYLPMIPDLAMARDRTRGWRHRLYRILSLGWRGSEAEWHHLKLAITILAFTILPVAFSVHTIVAWDFGMTVKVGWHSSIFGPYFVAGAIYSGVAAVATVLILVRRFMGMEYFLREEHLDAVGKLLLVFSLVWTYFFFSDYLTEWYAGEAVARQILTLQARGPVAPLWYTMLVTNVLIPWVTLWNRRVRRTPWALLTVALGINVGMYLERYLIVAGVLTRNRFPFDWGVYNPSIVEILISIGSLSTFLLLYVLASRLIPLIPVWEVQEGQALHTLRRIGKAWVPSVAEME